MAWGVHLHRTFHNVGRHLRRAVHTTIETAKAIDRGIQDVGKPLYHHVVRPLMQHRGLNTGRVDAALNSYDNFRRALN